MSGSEIKYDLIDKNFDETFFLEDLCYKSDVFFDQNEFLYLTGLRSNKTVTIQELKNACFYLKQKNRFDQISITSEDGNNGKKLCFNLKGIYFFNKLKIKGIIFGKDQYIQMYYLSYGDKFDINKHKKSLKKIKKDLSDQGFFNVNIKSNFKYDEINKLINIYLNVNKGKKYGIGNVVFEIKNSFLNYEELKLLHNNILNKFRSKFLKKRYSKLLLNKEKDNLKAFLLKNEFCFSKVDVKKEIRYLENKVDLKISISLGEKRCCNFIGNKFLSNAQLLNFVVNQDLLLEMPSSILAIELCNMYKQKGFLQASVEVVQKNDSFVLKINEGQRSRISNIVINGNHFINSKAIINKFFKLVMNCKRLNNGKLSIAIDNLKAFYQKNGFWDVKINKEIKFINDGRYIIDLNIDEGARKYLKNVKINNIKELENEAIFAQFNTQKKTIPFDINILNEQHKWLVNYMKKKNYNNIVVKPDFKIDDSCDISLAWNISYNDNNIKFGKTIIQGNNSKLPFERLIRQINFQEGQPWQKEKLEDSYFELNSSKIFDSVQLYPANYNDLNNNKPIILKISPDDPIEIRTRIGFEQVNKNLIFKGFGTYKVGGTFIYKNPFRFCDYFKLDAAASRFEKIFVGQYHMPWILSLPIRALFQLYFNKYDQPLFIGSNKNIYKASNVGFLLGISKKYNKFSYGFNLGVEGTKITDLSLERAEAIDFSPVLLDRRIPYLFFEPSLMIDYLDDKLYPTNGLLTVFSFKSIFSLQDSTDYFIKFLIEQSCFCNFSDLLILGLRARLGHIFVGDFSRIMPPTRFYLGGANTVRSYDPDFAPPLGKYTNEEGKVQFVPQGGKTLFNGNIELRIQASKKFSLVLFQDVGFLFGKNKQANLDTLLTATGFGLRYATPIGPLRFDIGWRPKKHKDDCGFMWFITLGQAF